MKRVFCLFFTGVLALGLAGCKTGKEKEEEPVKTIRNQTGDPSFSAFRNILNRAIERRDKKMLAQLMVSDFGYFLQEGQPEGVGIPGAFAYWDQHNLWPVLQQTSQLGYLPAGDYMVAPPEFALQGNTFQGFRLGVRRVNGSWRFIYFIGS